MKIVAIASQYLFVAAGLMLLWRHFLRPEARAQPTPPRLVEWTASLPELLFFIFHGLMGGFAASFVIGLLARSIGLEGDALTISATAALHCGMLGGVAFYLASNPGAKPSFAHGAVPGNVLTSGFATFLVAMPFVYLASLAWMPVMKLFGIEVERQPAVEMVERVASSPWLVLFITSAIVVAPMAEELLFRAGLFRYLRTRQNRWVALVLPSLLFAAIHFHLPSYLPLATLGIVFSLAYERTGSIGTAIVGHAFFNLNNLLVLLAGGGK